MPKLRLNRETRAEFLWAVPWKRVSCVLNLRELQNSNVELRMSNHERGFCSRRFVPDHGSSTLALRTLPWQFEPVTRHSMFDIRTSHFDIRTLRVFGQSCFQFAIPRCAVRSNLEFSCFR